LGASPQNYTAHIFLYGHNVGLSHPAEANGAVIGFFA
jgi:hypothetical protein